MPYNSALDAPTDYEEPRGFFDLLRSLTNPQRQLIQGAQPGGVPMPAARVNDYNPLVLGGVPGAAPEGVRDAQSLRNVLNPAPARQPAVPAPLEQVAMPAAAPEPSRVGGSPN